jgi:isochorismate hydrolase
VLVVEECVYDRTEAAHAMSLFDMDQKFADVVALEEALGWLEGLQREADSVTGGV